MTQFADAKKLEAWNNASQTAREELDAATEAGLAWMRANNYEMPPVEMQERLERAHAAWMGTLREMPSLFGWKV